MKKISLFKRLLSGVAAAALAATICFGDRVFNDLFASAADEDPTVVVKVLDGDEASTYDAHTDGMKYFVLGALVDKDAAITEATAKYEKDIIAWDCLKINPQNESVSTVTFNKFYKNDNDHTKFDRDQQEVEFDPAKHKFIATVYRYWVNDEWGGSIDNPYATKDVEPTNLIAPMGEGTYNQPWGQVINFNEQSSTTFDGYVNQNRVTGNTTTISINKHNVELYLRVNFSAPTTVTESDYLYVVIEAERADGTKMYTVQQILSDDTNRAEFTIQDKDVNNWTDAQGTSLQGAKYNGENTTARLFQSTKERTIRQLLEGEDAAEIEEGGYAKTQIVNFKGQSNNGGKITTKYYQTINFVLADEADSYTFREILGSGIAFGITADRFALNNHAQTNFATNYYRDLLSSSPETGQNIDPDLSWPSAGEIYIANFANLTDPTDISIDKLRKLTIGNTKEAQLIIHVTDKNRVEVHDPTNITIDASMTAAQMTNTVVNPIIQQMKAMSNRLASKDSTVTVVQADSRFNVNTLDYPDDATIYVDGDALAVDGEFNTEDIFKFTKKENQTIVINFKNTDKVTINTFEMTVVDNEGNVIFDGKDSSPDGLRGSDQNNFLDQQVMRKIVWNLNSVSNTKQEFKDNEPCVTIRNTAGIFLIPNAQTVTKIPSTSSGWLLSAGYVENNGGEWHFPYSELDVYEAPKTTSVVVSKKAITGDDELPGATIQIVDQVTGMNIGDTIWDYLVEANNNVQDGVIALKTDIDELKDVTYGMQWTSGDKPRTVILRDGAYTLMEFGETFTSEDGKTYKVVKSSVDFEITNGVITKAPKDVEDENGTIEYDSDPDTITIRDRAVDGKQTYYVHINKTDITGEVELEGARLTIYKANADGTKGERVASRVSSKEEGSVWNLALEPGDYILEETVDNGKEILDADGRSYKVIESTVKFTVGEDGKVTSSDTKDDFDGKSGAVLTTDEEHNDEPMIVIADARTTTKVSLSKTSVTGEKEIAGAVITIKDKETGKVIKQWTSKSETDSIEFWLEDGTYILEETGDTVTDTNGNTYKVLPSEVEFTVHNGKITSTSAVSSKDDIDQTTGGVIISGTDITVSDAYKTVKVTIKKTDVTGKAEVKGAKLTITDKATGKQVGNTWTSDGKNDWEIGLAPGTYVLKEEADSVVTDADGNEYQVITSEYEFTVGEDGKITEKKKVSSNEGNIALKDGVITVEDAIAAKVKKHYVRINKTDITGQTEVEGAVLTITDKDGTVVGSWTSKKGSTWAIPLEPGDYTLTETAAEGTTLTDENGITYKILSSTVEFTVSETGTVTCKSAKTSFDDIDTEGAVLTKDKNSNQPLLVICDAATSGKIKLNKTDVTGETELDNAKITITDENGKVVKEWVSKRGVTEEFILEDGTYTLKETAADGEKITDENGDEYDVIESSITFTVENGKVTSKTAQEDFDENADSGYVVVKDNEITVCDAKKAKASVTSSQSSSVVTSSQADVTTSESESSTQSGSVTSSSQSETKPSQSVSTPSQSVSSQSGSVTSSSQSETKPSQSVSTPSVTTPSQSVSTSASSSVKPTSTSKTESKSEATTTTKSSSNTQASSTTTTKASDTSATTDTQPTTTTGSGEGTPQTGHTGSTVTVAAMLAAVAALAIFKKKND